MNRFGPIEHEPVFILGNQKSGTTAVVCLLASATRSSFVSDYVEGNEPAQWRLYSGQLSLERFIKRARYPFSKKIIKHPGLTFLYPQLVQLYPTSRYVFVVRNPADNIRSILNRVKVPGNQRITDLRPFGMNLEWQRIIDSRWFGAQGEYHIEWLAHRWCMAADVYLGNRHKMTLMRYEDFMAGKQQAIETLAGTLGLTVKHDTSGEVDVQFQPKGDSTVDKTLFFGDNLRVIHQLCSSRMAQLGYSVP